MASRLGSAPVELPTPKKRKVGAGIKKSRVTLVPSGSLLLMVVANVPEATNLFGGREFCRKNPLTPTPNTPAAVLIEDANASVWLVGTLGKGTFPTLSKTCALVKVFWSGSIASSDFVTSGTRCELNSAKAVSSIGD